MKWAGTLFFLFVFSTFLYPKDTLKSHLYLNKGISLYSKKMYKKSMSQLNISLKYDNANGYTYLYRGICYYYLKKYKSSLADLKIALKLLTDKKSVYIWLSVVYKSLGDHEKSKKYREYLKNPPKIKTKILVEETISEAYHESGLKTFNYFQNVLGNKNTAINNKLNNAAKKHAEYIKKNLFNQRITTQWHYQVKGKPGFIGVYPHDQASAFGFEPSNGFFVGNTLIGWTIISYVEPSYLINHLVSTIYHRNMVIAPEFEGIGFYRILHKKKYLLVYFYSSKIFPKESTVIVYPAPGQTGIPKKMLPEIPDPFPGDRRVGFPITLQLFGKHKTDYTIWIEKASLKNSLGAHIPIYMLTPRSSGLAGQLMKALKMVCIASKNPLKGKTNYQVYMKVKDSENKVLFDNTWNFTTE